MNLLKLKEKIVADHEDNIIPIRAVEFPDGWWLDFLYDGERQECIILKKDWVKFCKRHEKVTYVTKVTVNKDGSFDKSNSKPEVVPAPWPTALDPIDIAYLAALDMYDQARIPMIIKKAIQDFDEKYLKQFQLPCLLSLT